MKKIIRNLPLQDLRTGERKLEIHKGADVLDITTVGNLALLTYICDKDEKDKEEKILYIVGEKFCPDLSNCKYLNTTSVLIETNIVSPNPDSKTISFLHFFMK